MSCVTAKACSRQGCGGRDTIIDSVNAAKHGSHAIRYILKFDDFTEKNYKFQKSKKNFTDFDDFFIDFKKTSDFTDLKIIEK